MQWMGVVLIGVGVFSFLAAVMDWDFYMESRKAAFIVAIFGRNGARIFYALLGIFIVVCALFVIANPEQAFGNL